MPIDTYAVQMTLDRIIFLRICEDRNIEPYETLKKVSQKPGVYTALKALFLDADKVYNSGLFHFKDESGREGKDCVTPDLHIDDDVLYSIIGRMYYPLGPYLFAVMPADILGQVYERFLGKVIDIDNGTVSIIDKPEVKKAGGVFYTPEYIVDYIVKNTVGKLLDEAPVNSTKAKTGRAKKIPPPELGGAGGGKQLTPVEASKLRILDPACGSGAFLINAYQYLLDWHLAWYKANDPEKWAEVIRGKKGKDGKPAAVEKDGKGVWRLTLSERKRILSNNIYGVDIDRQAVEVTKLSLLLKCLELEGKKAIQQEFTFFKERALPDLDNNIKCGNSLIERDIFKQGDFDEQEKRRINPFNWQDKFKSIMDEGGFDAVIGNPPYVDIKGMPETDVRYIFNKYPCMNNRVNLFAAFIERTLACCKQSGFNHSMIIPTALLTQNSYRALRKKIIENYYIFSVVRLPNESFGASAGAVKVDTVIICLQQKTENPSPIQIISYSGYDRISAIDDEKTQIKMCVMPEQWSQPDDYIWTLNTNSEQISILDKIELKTIELESLADFSLGLTPYDKYKGHTESQIKDRVFHADFKKDETFKPLLAGNDVGRYWIEWNKTAWISYGTWLGAPRQSRFFTQKRILVKQIIDWSDRRIWATITSEELYNSQNAFNLLVKTEIELEFLLGIINSKLMSFYHRKKYLDEFKMRFQKILIKDAKRLPIRKINLNVPQEKQMHDDLVTLVTDMLQMHKELAKAKLPNDIETKKDEIKEKDAEIDALVYKLYGLTEAEIAIVEGASS